MATLDFIKSNPVLDEISRSRKEDREERLSDARAALLAGQTEDMTRSRDARLRAYDANANLAETHAQTAKDEAPYAGPKAASGLRKINADAVNSEMGIFSKGIELAKTHGPAASKEFTQGAGMPPISDDLLNSADFQGRYGEFEAKAAKDYAGRPADWKKATQSFIDEYRRLHPNLPAEATVPYSVPGAPEPQTTSGGTFQRFNTTGQDENGNMVPGVQVYNSKDEGPGTFQPHAPIQKPAGTGAGANATTGLMKNAKFYVDNGVAPDVQSAVNMLRASVNDPAIFNRLVQAEKKNMRLDPKLMNASDADLETQAQQNVRNRRQAAGTVAPPAAPVAPVAPAAQRPDLMTPGNGTQPQNIQLPPRPPNVPDGAGYSPGSRTWHTRDGGAFDGDGNPLQ